MYYDPHDEYEKDEALAGLDPQPTAAPASPADKAGLDRFIAMQAANGLAGRDPPAPTPARPPPQAQLFSGYADPQPRETGLGILGDEGAEWAALLDVALNKGRGVGSILTANAQRAGQERERARTEGRQAKLDRLNEESTRAQMGELGTRHNDDAFNRWYKTQQIGQHEVDTSLRTMAQADVQKMQMEKLEREQGKDADDTRAARAVYALTIGDTATVNEILKNASPSMIGKLGPALNLFAHLNNPDFAKVAGDTTGARTDAALQSRADNAPALETAAAAQARGGDFGHLTYAKALADARASGAAAGSGMGEYRKRREDYAMASSFHEKNREQLDLAGLFSEIDDGGGAVPQNIAERFAGSKLLGPWASRGVTPERLNVTQAKQLVVEKFLRSLTGKATTMPEEDRIFNEVGSNPLASPEQVEAAYNVLQGVIRRGLRGAAVNNPAAVEVLGQYVADPQGYLGLTQAPQPGALPPAPPPAAAPPRAAPPQQLELPTGQPEPVAPAQAAPPPQQQQQQPDPITALVDEPTGPAPSKEVVPVDEGDRPIIDQIQKKLGNRPMSQAMKRGLAIVANEYTPEDIAGMTSRQLWDLINDQVGEMIRSQHPAADQPAPTRPAPAPNRPQPSAAPKKAAASKIPEGGAVAKLNKDGVTYSLPGSEKAWSAQEIEALRQKGAVRR